MDIWTVIKIIAIIPAFFVLMFFIHMAIRIVTGAYYKSKEEYLRRITDVKKKYR